MFPSHIPTFGLKYTGYSKHVFFTENFEIENSAFGKEHKKLGW